MSVECQVNIKSQSELDIGGHETCQNTSYWLTSFSLPRSSASKDVQVVSRGPKNVPTVSNVVSTLFSTLYLSCIQVVSRQYLGSIQVVSRTSLHANYISLIDPYKQRRLNEQETSQIKHRYKIFYRARYYIFLASDWLIISNLGL